jgi:hypothetical protein
MGEHIINRTDKTTIVWKFPSGNYHGACDCGWTDKPRWFKAMATDRAWCHAAATGHSIASPLVTTLLPPNTPRRRSFSRLVKRLTPWPVLAALPLLLIPAGLWLAPDAHGIARYDTITVAVTWTGEPACINAWEPDPADRRDLRYGAICNPDRTASATYVAHPGEWVGADPQMSGADIVACSLAVNGQIVYSDGAARGDGHQVSCLRKWV